MWSGLWRNSNAPNGTNTAGWTALTMTDVGQPSGWTRAVSCIGVSKANSPNVVYFGTTDGLVKRVDSANATTPTVTDVTPPGLNGGTAQGGFVRCVAVDPTNSNNALVAFGNYNFQSLWYTTNGGQTWTDVEGNLAGADGPSIRWASMFYAGNQFYVFLATSIGVLMTNELNGSSTVWVHAAASEIGNILIGYLDYREADRTLAVGTHARGVFTTQIPTGPTGVEETQPEVFVLRQNYPNPFNPSTKIEFKVQLSGFTTLKVYDILGREVRTLVSENLQPGRYEVTFDARQANGEQAGELTSGVYLYRLTTSTGFSQTRKMLLMR
jgi:hypothetical protein